MKRLVLLTFVAAACSPRPPPGQRTTEQPAIATVNGVEAGPSAPVPAPLSSAPVDAGPKESFADVLDFRSHGMHVEEGYARAYDWMLSTAPARAPRLAVLCRVSVIEPAPLPVSAWDRANGRDLMVATTIEGDRVRQFQGPLGAPVFHLRADDDLNDAATKLVRWTVFDRDQQRAFPYDVGVEVGSFDLPRGVTAPRLSSPTLSIACRAAPAADATAMLLTGVDATIDAVEKSVEWGPKDPRSVSELRTALQPATESLIRAGVIERTPAWKGREARLEAIVRKHRAREREFFDNVHATPAGTWAAIGPTATARVVQQLCPGVPKGQDPGPLNEEQRNGCGLVLEVKASGAPIRWTASLGDIYACRDPGPLGLEMLSGPGDTEPPCVLGYRRGAASWQKTTALLERDVATTVVLGAYERARWLRLTIHGDSAIFDVPPRP